MKKFRQNHLTGAVPLRLAACLVAVAVSGCKKADIAGGEPPVPVKKEVRLSVDESERLPLLSKNYAIGRNELLAYAEGVIASISAQEVQTKGVTKSRRAVLSDSMVSANPYRTPATKSEPGYLPEEVKIYVVDFGDNAGFVLLAGDRRVPNKIVGYSDTGNFDIEGKPGADYIVSCFEAYVASEIARVEGYRGDSIYLALERHLGGVDPSSPTRLWTGDLPTWCFEHMMDDCTECPKICSTHYAGGCPECALGNPQGNGTGMCIPVTNGYVWQYRNIDSHQDVFLYAESELLYQKGPLMQSRWGQGSPYKKLIQWQLLPGVYLEDFVPTGCTATAVAQIMNYHKHGSYSNHTYRWNDYKNHWSDDWETDDLDDNVARLFVDLGLPHNLDVQYDPDGSGAQDAHVPRTFVHFGYTYDYSSSPIRFFEASVVKQSVNSNRPAFVSGNNNKSGDEFKGHTWVIDGHREDRTYSWSVREYYYQGEYVGKGLPVRSFVGDTFSMHCNWGWDGEANGFFAVNDFTPRIVDPSYAPGTGHYINHDYRHNNKMITGIRPQ